MSTSSNEKFCKLLEIALEDEDKACGYKKESYGELANVNDDVIGHQSANQDVTELRIDSDIIRSIQNQECNHKSVLAEMFERRCKP